MWRMVMAQKKDAVPFCAAFPELMRNAGHEAF